MTSSPDRLDVQHTTPRVTALISKLDSSPCCIIVYRSFAAHVEVPSVEIRSAYVSPLLTLGPVFSRTRSTVQVLLPHLLWGKNCKTHPTPPIVLHTILHLFGSHTNHPRARVRHPITLKTTPIAERSPGRAASWNA